jgi:hypothetical protein
LKASNPKVESILNDNLVFVYHFLLQGMADYLNNTRLKRIIVNLVDDLGAQFTFESSLKLLEAIIFIFTILFLIFFFVCSL